MGRELRRWGGAGRCQHRLHRAGGRPGVTFTYVLATHLLTVRRQRPGRRRTSPSSSGALARPGPPRRGTCRRDTPERSLRLHWSPDGLARRSTRGRHRWAVAAAALDPAGAPEPTSSQATRTWRRTRRCGCRPRTPSRLPRSSPGSSARGRSTTTLGRLLDATGVQIPGVLDDVYAARAERAPRRDLAGGTPTLRALGADRARTSTCWYVAPGSATDTRVDAPRRPTASGRRAGRPQWNGASYRYEVEVYVPAPARSRRTSSPTRTRVALTDGLGAHRRRRPGRPALTPQRLVDARQAEARRSRRTRRSTSCTSATSRSATRPCPRRSAAPTCAFTDTGQRRHEAPAGAGRRRA